MSDWLVVLITILTALVLAMIVSEWMVGRRRR